MRLLFDIFASVGGFRVGFMALLSTAFEAIFNFFFSLSLFCRSYGIFVAVHALFMAPNDLKPIIFKVITILEFGVYVAELGQAFMRLFSLQ